MELSEEFKNLAKEFQNQSKEFEDEIKEIAEDGRVRAIRVATEKTPPTKNDGKLRGKNMITGKLKAGWTEASDTEVKKDGDGWSFTLANNVYYASYVDQGHDLKKHFVPGLHIDEERGVLYFDDEEPGGIFVGTKTQKVQGVYMSDQAIQEWEKFMKEKSKELGIKIGLETSGGE